MDNNQLPMKGGIIESRPIYVEEWLDALPYVDFNNTTRVLHAALKATNAIAMKANQRMELVELYNRPYQYYLDTQIRAGAQHTLQSIENMQSRVANMKMLAVELARASRQSVDDALSHKSLWGQNKQPLQAVLMTINYLSHTLIFNFLEYAPVPARAWQELNFLYQYTENIEQQNTPVKLIGGDKKSTTSTIEQAYKRIALVTLADPYHLPFGAIWEIHEQVKNLTDLTVMGQFREVSDPNGVFVVNLANDKGPLPYIKFNRANAAKQHRLFITEKLLVTISNYRNQLKGNNDIDSSLVLSDYYAEHLLDIISKAWGMPPKRYFPRKTRTGRLDLAHGINSIFYFLNEEQEFTDNDHAQEEIITDEPVTPVNIKQDYKKERWQLVDTSGGGFAMTREGKPQNTLRVGDLIGMSLDEENYPRETFRVGVLRWLLVRHGKFYKAGVQLINQQIYPASIQATGGNPAENSGRRAILAGRPARQKEIPIITSKGLYSEDRELQINFKDQVFNCSIVKQLESTTCFDHFTVMINADQ